MANMNREIQPSNMSLEDVNARFRGKEVIVIIRLPERGEEITTVGLFREALWESDYEQVDYMDGTKEQILVDRRFTLRLGTAMYDRKQLDRMSKEDR